MSNVVKHYLDQPFKWKGKTLYADCYLMAEPDDVDPAGDFDFGDAKANAEYLARFRSGELQMIRLHVRAVFKGFEGNDYLGACHIPAENYANECVVLCQDYGMVQQALDDLIRHMESVESALKEVSNG